MTSEELNSYDKYIVAFSGGKDSTACFLHLLESGIPKEKIELWHQDIDGHGPTFMDWEITPDYCKAFAKAFGVPILFSYREGGFEREMLRNGTATAPTHFQDIDGTWHTAGGKGKPGTRLKFPQVSGDLSVRWCSSYCKIDVCCIAIRNSPRFKGKRVLVLSGERGEESKQRAGYAILEMDKAGGSTKKNAEGVKVEIRSKDRHVDRYRPIRDWVEQEVWAIMERHKVRAHPAYFLGFSRCSCKFCIFGNADQFASGYAISPIQGNRLISYEEQFGYTMKRNETLPELLSKGVAYDMDEELVALATSYTYTESIFMDNWLLPKGAYKEGCGPT